MQTCEMRTLRNLYPHKELLNLTKSKTKFISNPISCTHSKNNKHFSNCFHSETRNNNNNNGRFSSEKSRRKNEDHQNQKNHWKQFRNTDRWHPARYRTQLCNRGSYCNRQNCFFAHSKEQLRVYIPPAESPPPSHHGSLQNSGNGDSTTSTLISASFESRSPPISPSLSRPIGSNLGNEMIGSSGENPRVSTSYGNGDSMLSSPTTSTLISASTDSSTPPMSPSLSRPIGDSNSGNEMIGLRNENPRVSLSSLFLESSVSAVDKSSSSEEEKKEEEESVKGNARSWTSSYERGSEPFRPKTEKNLEGLNFGLTNSFGDENGFSNENLRVWSSFDPVSDEHVNRAVSNGDGYENQEVGSSNESPRVSLSSFDTNVGLKNSSDDENGLSNEKPRVSTYFDPVSNELVTRVVGDDFEKEEVGSDNESPRVSLSSFDSVVGLTNSIGGEDGFSNENPRVWTSYDHVSDELVTRAVSNGDGYENQEVGSSVERPGVRLSSFDSVAGNFSPKSSVSAVNKSAAEEEEGGKGKSMSWLSSYNKGNDEPFRQKTENQEGVNLGKADSFGDENCFSNENSRVRTTYDYVLGELVPRAVSDDYENQEVGSSGEIPRVRLSSFDSFVGNFSPKSSISAVNKLAVEEESAKGKSRSWSCSYSKGSEPFQPKIENQEGVNLGKADSFGDENGFSNENPRVWTSHDPVSDEHITRAVGDDSENQEVGLSTGSPRVHLSSFDSVDGNFSPQSSVEAVNKSLEEEEEEESAKGKPKSWSSSYKRENEPFRRKNENQEGVKVNSGSGSGSSSSPQSQFVLKKKTGKSKMSWVCSSCGYSTSQWWGRCKSCQAEGTMSQISLTDVVEDKSRRSWLPAKSGETQPQRLTDVNKGINQLTWRIPLSGRFGAEVARVLGGGLVPGCLVLVGGDPGVGKSTLLLQIAAMIAEEGDFGRPAPVVYVSGEESVEQIGNRADRMSIGTEELFLYSSTDIEDILKKIQVLSPRALIVDSIQTVYLQGVTGSAGGLSQVKECTSALLRFAKSTNIPVLLIGHVTKTGEIAGPRVLEHIVDVVLYMEGEKYSSHRFLRSVKNRFGSSDELGVFEMSQSGLQAVLNPSEIFLSEQQPESEVLAGLAVAVVIDGSRTFLIEIQALCLSDTSVSRHVTGVLLSRCDMIISVLIKQAGLKLQDNAIYVNVVGGVPLTETAGDLAIAAAICSSFLEFAVPNDVAFIGEIGLGGELRGVSRIEKRVNAVAKLGYKMCIVPKSAEKSLADLKLGDMTILGCKNLKEVLNNVFRFK